MVTYMTQLHTISDDLPDGPNRHGQMDTKKLTTRTTELTAGQATGLDRKTTDGEDDAEP